MKFLIRFCGNRIILVLFITSFMILILDLLGITLIYPFLKVFSSPDIIISNKNIRYIYEYVGFSKTGHFILLFGLLLLVVYIIKFFIKLWITKIKNYTSNSVTYRLSRSMFDNMLNSRYSLFADNSVSEMITVINGYTVHCTICLESWINILNEAAILIILFGVFIFIDPLAWMIIVSAFCLIGVLVYLGLVKKITIFGQIHTKLNLLVYKYGFAVASSIKDIKIMGLEDKHYNKISQIWKEYNVNESKFKTAKIVPKDLAETMVFGGIIIVCVYVLLRGKEFMDMLPVLGLVAVSAMRILPSFNKIMTSYNEYKFYSKSLLIVEELYEKLLKSRQEIISSDIPFKDELVIDRLSFSYKDEKVLDDISFRIKKGSSVAFVGSSGVGKSTLLDVLVGLREADSGQMTLDGKKFDPFSTDALKRRVGYVPQNVNLIDETIAFNISFERDYDEKKMDYVINIAHLSKFISELKDGIDTVVGESGVRLSGGQKQRIGIARALYREPEILIFDEATSSLDNITERNLMKEINSLSQSKTLIIVAHRLTTVESCDMIYLLDKGHIIASGSHIELLNTSREYQALYHEQLDYSE